MDIAAISPSEVDGTTRVKLHIDLTYVATFLLNSYSWGREQKTEGDGIGRSRGSITKNVLTWKDVESLPLLGTIPSLSVAFLVESISLNEWGWREKVERGDQKPYHCVFLSSRKPRRETEEKEPPLFKYLPSRLTDTAVLFVSAKAGHQEGFGLFMRFRQFATYLESYSSGTTAARWGRRAGCTAARAPPTRPSSRSTKTATPSTSRRARPASAQRRRCAVDRGGSAAVAVTTTTWDEIFLL